MGLGFKVFLGHIGIMERSMETTIIMGLYWVPKVYE